MNYHRRLRRINLGQKQETICCIWKSFMKMTPLKAKVLKDDLISPGTKSSLFEGPLWSYLKAASHRRKV